MVSSGWQKITLDPNTRDPVRLLQAFKWPSFLVDIDVFPFDLVSLRSQIFKTLIGCRLCLCARSSGGGRQLHSDLELPEQLQDFWYPVAFSSQLKEGAMVTMELFGQPWVLFRDAQGLPSCVKDACAHRACPLSLVRPRPFSN